MPSVSCKRVWLQSAVGNGDAAIFPNGGVVVIGDINVVATEATRRGKMLFPTQGEWFNVSNTNLLYIDVTDAGTVVHWYIEI